MPTLMLDVIFNQKSQRNRLIFAHFAGCPKPFFRNAIHHSRKNLMFCLPPTHECIPGHAGISVRGNPRVLRILWAGIAAIYRRADKALPVIPCRVQQMTEDLLARPSAFAPRGVGKRRRNCEERVPQHAQLNAKIMCKLGRHFILGCGMPDEAAR